MERSRAIQIIIILVIFSFIIGWFAYFQREEIIEEEKVAQFAIGHAKGKIQRYRNELFLTPWRRELEWLANIEGVEEIKVLNDRAVLLLKESPVKVRNLIKKENVSAEALAMVIIAEPVDFRLENGTTVSFPIRPFYVRIDPITPIWEELSLEIVAVISQQVEEFMPILKANEKNTTIEISANNTICEDYYLFEFEIPWEERNVLLENVTEEFFYERDDRIFFREIPEDMLELIAMFEYIVEIGENFAIVNITEKEKIENDFSLLNISIVFPSSKLKMYGKYDVRDAFLSKFPKANEWKYEEKILCRVNLLEVDNFLVKYNKRTLELYLKEFPHMPTKIPVKISYIGWLIEEIESIEP